MKRQYVKRKQTRDDLARRVGDLIGIRTRTAYLTRKEWQELLITIEYYQKKLSEIINESTGTIQA